MIVSVGKIRKAVKDNPYLPYSFVRDVLISMEEIKKVRITEFVIKKKKLGIKYARY